MGKTFCNEGFHMKNLQEEVQNIFLSLSWCFKVNLKSRIANSRFGFKIFFHLVKPNLSLGLYIKLLFCTARYTLSDNLQVFTLHNLALRGLKMVLNILETTVNFCLS